MPHTGSVGKGLKPVKVQPEGGELAAGRWGRERAGPRGGGLGTPCPGRPERLGRGGLGMLQHGLPPSHGKDVFPGHLARGQAWELSGMGMGDVFYIQGVHRLLPSGTPLSSHSGQETKATERVCKLPRVTQRSTEGTGLPTNQLRFLGLLWEAQGSL